MVQYEFELFHAAQRLINEILGVQEGEIVCVTADTSSNQAVANTIAAAAFAAGAKPMTIWTPTPLGVGKAADSMLPEDSLVGALSNCDVWIEINQQWLLYSTTFDKTMASNKDIRYINLVGMNPDMMIRTIGRVDILLLREFLDLVTEITSSGKHIRVTTPAGTDLEFENHPDREFINHSGIVPKGTYEMLPGQVSWTPKLETINGTMVIDGTLTPPCGHLEEPVKLTIEKGRVVKIEGGMQAEQFRKWLESFDDENMYQLAHISYGFNPGARLSGDIVEDERVWGATEWGIGNIGPRLVPDIPGGVPAASHCDGINLNSSVWVDGKQILDRGKVVYPEKLVELAKKLGTL